MSGARSNAKKIVLYMVTGLVAMEIMLCTTMSEWRIEHTLRIDAAPARVWGLLTDFHGYSAWNTYTPRVSGEFSEGAIVRSQGHLGGANFDVNNEIVEIVPGQRFCWRSLNWYRHLVSGIRCRNVFPAENATMFVHEEVFHGPLAWLLKLTLRDRIKTGVKTHDENLKAAAETSPH